MVLPSPAGGNLPTLPCEAAVLRSGGVPGRGVLLTVGWGLAMAGDGLGSGVADGVERLLRGARRSRSTRELVSTPPVPWVGGSGDGPAVTIAWLGAGPAALVPRTGAALAPGSSSVPTSGNTVPSTCPTVLPSGWGSPAAPITSSGVGTDSGDVPAAVFRGTLGGDTRGAIPAVGLPSRRGETSPRDATGAVVALGTPEVPGTAILMPATVLGDHISVPGAAPPWGPAWSGEAGVGPGMTPVPRDAEPAVRPGWLLLGDALGASRVALVSHSIVVALPPAADAVPIPFLLTGVLLTRMGAGPVPMPYLPREDVGAAVA